MRQIVLFLLLLALPLQAAPELFLEGRLEADVPTVFRPLDEAAIDQMFSGAKSRPSVVLATPDSETRISMTYASALLGPGDLEGTKDTLKRRMLDQIGVVWRDDKMVTLNETPWFRLDYDTTASGQAKREIILGTSVQERLLFLIVSTPLEDQEVLEVELESLIASLRLVPTTP